ncbi:hypothetical protein V8C86DRAFT_2689463 [Haematococcus lacustris]
MARLSRAALLAECFQDVRELLLGSTRARISFTTMLAVFAFMLYVHLGKPAHRRPAHASLTTVRSPPSSELWSSLPRQQVQLSPTYEVLEGLEAVWQKPERPLGLLLTAHGCNHGGVDFFPAHPHSCPLCTGKPGSPCRLSLPLPLPYCCCGGDTRAEQATRGRGRGRATPSKVGAPSWMTWTIPSGRILFSWHIRLGRAEAPPSMHASLQPLFQTKQPDQI